MIAGSPMTRQHSDNRGSGRGDAACMANSFNFSIDLPVGVAATLGPRSAAATQFKPNISLPTDADAMPSVQVRSGSTR